MAWLAEQGHKQVDQGLHDDYGITSIMMSVDPESVRYQQRVVKGLDSINGLKITPVEKTQEVGRKAVEWRATKTVDAIQKAIGAKTRRRSSRTSDRGAAVAIDRDPPPGSSLTEAPGCGIYRLSSYRFIIQRTHSEAGEGRRFLPRVWPIF